MKSLSSLILALGLLLGLSLGLAPAGAQTEADPPGRVGRLAEVSGVAWWFDPEQGRWSEARRNHPVTAGDRLATGRDGAVELRIGSTTLKLAEGSEIELPRLDDERVRVHLHRGSVAIRLRSREVAAETDFGTDEAWLQPQRGGLYRLDREDDTTFATSWRGELRVMGNGAPEVDTGRRLQLWRDPSTRTLQHRWMPPRDDAFAARVLREDRDDVRTASATYVSPETTGFEDLDRHGRWESHPEYGPVWYPLSVAADWAPFRHGRWTWVRPWGWTWVDDSPWGFAPFHYGRWVQWRNRWCWVPGPYVPRPVYSPALVTWVDGPGVSVSVQVGGPRVGWVPLAPWDPYRPHYRSSPSHRDRVDHPDFRRWRPPTGRVAAPVAPVDPGVPQWHGRPPGEPPRPRPEPVLVPRDEPTRAPRPEVTPVPRFEPPRGPSREGNAPLAPLPPSRPVVPVAPPAAQPAPAPAAPAVIAPPPRDVPPPRQTMPDARSRMGTPPPPAAAPAPPQPAQAATPVQRPAPEPPKPAPKENREPKDKDEKPTRLNEQRSLR